MSLQNQLEWETQGRIDPSCMVTTEWNLLKVEWTADDMLMVVAKGMRGCVPTIHTEAFLEIGLPNSKHKWLNREFRDLTVGYCASGL